MTPTTRPPAPVDWRNLIWAGEDLLNPPGGWPTEEHIRRAVSNSYYALFHALAASNANVLVGTPQDAVDEEAWTRVYRGLDHGKARRELQQLQGGLSVEAQYFADVFTLSQENRHLADYDRAWPSPCTKPPSGWKWPNTPARAIYRRTAASGPSSRP